MPAEDMNRRKERMLNEAKKIVDNINAMTFSNLDDQQVHSLMTIREIARGIAQNRVEKVTRSDVKKALSYSIEKMVGSCKDVNSILSRIPCEGMDDEQTRSVSRMKEIVSTIVTRRTKALTTRREPVDSAGGVDAETVESKMGGATTSTKDVDIGDIQRRLFTNEVPEAEAGAGAVAGAGAGARAVAEAELRNKDGQSEAMDIVMDGPTHSGNGDVQVGGEQRIVPAGATDASNEMIGWTEGTMFEDVQLVVEDDIRTEDGPNEMQETVNGTSELRNEDSQNELGKSISLSPPLRLSLTWPPDGNITLDWVKNMMAALEQSSKKEPPSEFWSLMPISVVDKLINAASNILSKEPNCVEIDCCNEDSRVVVVGDVHGQFHDLLNLFNLAGLPSENQYYIFNGNYIDKGAWGVEVFLVLLAWKVLMPNRVYLLRGNHETKFCTSVYGFEEEVKTKFGDQGEMVYKNCLECFKELPLASIIGGCVYTTHGGLFRSIYGGGPLRRSKRKRTQRMDLGSLEDLSKVNRSLVDAPDGGPNALLADVLWSNPSKEDGLDENSDRGMGLLWGPDCTEAFLKQSKLKLIIRSHEGPDARAGQDDFGDMLRGYSIDHDGESGKLYTLFSAPDYPQFGETKYYNEGAYAVLKPPNFESPAFHSFRAVERPKIHAQLTKMDGSSSSRTNFPAWMRSRVDFEAMGIFNPPSWNVSLANNGSGTKAVQVPRAPAAEGLPLPSDLQEPHKAAFEYLFELIGALKHMISTKVIENGIPESVGEESVPNENEQNNEVNEGRNDEVNEGRNDEVNKEENEVINVGKDSEVREGQENEVKEGQDKEVKEGQDKEVKEGPDKEVKEGQDKEDKEGKDKVVKEGQDKVVKEGKDKVVKEGQDKEVKEGQDKVVKEGQDKEVKEGQDKEVKEGQDKVVKEGQDKEGQDKEVKEGKDKEVKEGQDKEVKEGQDKEVREGQAPDNEVNLKPSESA